MLNKQVCRKCLAREHGFEGEIKTGSVSCYPPLDNNEIKAVFRQFDEEWDKGKVWCLGQNDVPVSQSDISSEGIFVAFKPIKGDIPGCCRFKEEQLGPTIWERVKYAIEREKS